MLSRSGFAIAAVLLTTATLKASNNFAFTGTVNRSGDTSGAVQVADDFIVTAPNGINVTQLGLFIDGYDGFIVPGPAESHKVALYNRATNTLVTSLTISSANISTIDGPYLYSNPGASNSISPYDRGAYGYANIPTLFLPNGFQGSIVAYTLSDAGAYVDDYGEGASFNSGGSLISFSHSNLAVTTSTSGDPTGNSSTTARAGASFNFSAAAPVPEPASLVVLALGGIVFLRRSR